MRSRAVSSKINVIVVWTGSVRANDRASSWNANDSAISEGIHFNDIRVGPVRAKGKSQSAGNFQVTSVQDHGLSHSKRIANHKPLSVQGEFVDDNRLRSGQV